MSEGIIDRKAIERLLDVIGGDSDDLLELIDEFKESTPGMLVKMQEAVAEADHNALRILAHSLKSNARDFGATTLAKLCEQLERDCKSGLVSDPGSQVGAISSELKVATATLAQLGGSNE